MSDDNYFRIGRTAALRSLVLGQMLTGAGWAALVLVVAGFSLYAIWVVGLLLPPESKEAPAPMPQTYLSAPVDSVRQV